MQSPPPTAEPRKRPDWNDRRVVERHLAAIREDVRKYLVNEGEQNPDMDAVMQQVERAMRFESVDGYRIARNLEDRGWSADSGLVELMDRLAAERSAAHRQVVREWVVAEGIKPALAVGAQVKVAVDRCWNNREGTLVDGEVTSVDAEQAQYVVFMESRGHVREGLGTHGLVLDFEDVGPR